MCVYVRVCSNILSLPLSRFVFSLFPALSVNMSNNKKKIIMKNMGGLEDF